MATYFRSRLAYLKYKFRIIAARRWWLLNNAYQWNRRQRHLLFNSQTELVIEGFPRSANTFATRAFSSVNPNVKIAHHMHAQAQIIKAVRQRLPVLVLIRKPEPAVRSLLVRHPEFGQRSCLISYINFYEDIELIKDSFVLATFEDVTSNFGSVIDRLNQKFDKRFKPFHHNSENSEKIFDEMDIANTRFYGKYKVTHIPHPDQNREKMKHLVQLDTNSPLHARAQNIYERMTRKNIPTG